MPAERGSALVVTSGWYHTISFVINAARVQLEPWAARFPRAVG
jgi:4-carboxymuconolactone decarboxylase